MPSPAVKILALIVLITVAVTVHWSAKIFVHSQGALAGLVRPGVGAVTVTVGICCGDCAHASAGVASTANRAVRNEDMDNSLD